MLTMLFFGVQLISLGVMLLFIHEYKRITFKHEEMMKVIEDEASPKSVFHSTVIIWIYAGITFAILIGTTAFFYTIISDFS